MFKKLELSIDKLDLKKLVGEESYRPTGAVEFEIKDRTYLYDKIKNHINFKIKPDYELVGIIKYPGTFPHTDYWNVSLNYYISTNNESTMFWKNKDNKITRNDTAYIFDSNLIEIGSFLAKKNEFYLLDTKIIHSIKVEKNTDIRFILRFVWNNNSFEEILNSIIPL